MRSKEPRTAQVIICKCGSVFAACIVPECYLDIDWQKDLRQYVKEGCDVKIMEAKKFSLEKCKCKEVSLENNQLKLL